MLVQKTVAIHALCSKLHHWRTPRLNLEQF